LLNAVLYLIPIQSSAQLTIPTSTKDAKVFCCESEQLMKTWVAGIRLAKVCVCVCCLSVVMSYDVIIVWASVEGQLSEVSCDSV